MKYFVFIELIEEIRDLKLLKCRVVMSFLIFSQNNFGFCKNNIGFSRNTFGFQKYIRFSKNTLGKNTFGFQKINSVKIEVILNKLGFQVYFEK